MHELMTHVGITSFMEWEKLTAELAEDGRGIARSTLYEWARPRHRKAADPARLRLLALALAHHSTDMGAERLNFRDVHARLREAAGVADDDPTVFQLDPRVAARLGEAEKAELERYARVLAKLRDVNFAAGRESVGGKPTGNVNDGTTEEAL